MELVPGRAVFVSDFDGTLARPDFYQLLRRELVPPSTPDYWQAYRSGQMTHFDALQSYFAAAESSEAALQGITERMELPENLPHHVQRLQAAGWELIIVSAGCRWYIDLLLEKAGVQVPIFANPGHLEDGRLVMERPATAEYMSDATGIEKAGIVQSLLREDRRVAFAGDGVPDMEAARLVDAGLRFARADLAQACREKGLPFVPFECWEDVVNALVG